MNRKCKIKPSKNTCLSCMDIQMEYGVVEDCSKCKSANEIYELIAIKDSFWSGTYAVVSKDGDLQKISIDRIRLQKE